MISQTIRSGLSLIARSTPTFPAPTTRYDQTPNEIYGRSPAMQVLPAIKTLNEQKKTMLRQGHRVVDPVLLLPDDGVIDAFSLKAGSPAIDRGAVLSSPYAGSANSVNRGSTWDIGAYEFEAGVRLPAPTNLRVQ